MEEIFTVYDRLRDLYTMSANLNKEQLVEEIAVLMNDVYDVVEAYDRYVDEMAFAEEQYADAMVSA